MTAYTRELVERLLPTLWDESYARGMQDPSSPDPDMPKAASNKAHGNTLAAHLADVRAGWAHAPLTREQRQAVLLRFGLDMTYASAGRVLGVSKQSVQRLAEAGVGAITFHLNGDVLDDAEAA